LTKPKVTISSVLRHPQPRRHDLDPVFASAFTDANERIRGDGRAPDQRKDGIAVAFFASDNRNDGRESGMRAIGLMKDLLPADEAPFATLIPTEIVSSDEYLPAPQTEKREVEARLRELGSTLARKQGISRRRSIQTATGMAASYFVMNEVYGPLFSVAEAERWPLPSSPPSAPRRSKTKWSSMSTRISYETTRSRRLQTGSSPAASCGSGC
jgi:hypothetical protein